MNANQILATYKSTLHFLATGQLQKAFKESKILVNELQIGEFTDRLTDLQQNYQYLLEYYVAGVKDPQQKIVYNKLISKCYILNSQLKEELLLRNSSAYEYTQKRYFPFTKKYNSPKELLISLRYYHSQSALIVNLSDFHEVELKRLRSNYETALSELFSLYWLTSTYETNEKSLYTALMQPDYPGWLEKSMVVSALTLNLWRMFDENKILLLLDACQHPDLRIKQRALVGLCFVLAKHNRFLTYFPAIRNRLVLLADDNRIVENFQNIIIQIISTAETDKISKKMQEEILPEMIKISPKVKGKMDADSASNGDEWNDENPDWQDLLNESGITDKLKELSDLQLEGADVYMSTFSLLKNFPFFSTFSNWLLPFDTQQSDVKELFHSTDKSLLTAFVSNNVMCNSDKYSFCLSILQMPESQRGMLKQSFQMEADQLDEMTKDEAILTPDIAAKNCSKLYIQDLFRFFKLNPQHTEFSNMFDFSLKMHRTFLFNILSTNSNFKESIAEYYFLKNHYNEALELFEIIEHETTPTASLYQKIGYSYQQISNFERALSAYEKADIIQPDDLWTIRKIALCYRLSQNFAKALEYYQHIDFLKPDQKSVLMQIGYCYTELKKHKLALGIYFKLDATSEEDIRIWRAISWCSFVIGDLAQADYYAEKILNSNPSEQDFLNSGHIAWCLHKLPRALELYKKCLSFNNSKELFLESLLNDKVFLLSNGIDADEIPLMLDALTI